MITVAVSIDGSRLKALGDALGNKLPSAIRRALVRSATTVRAEMTRAISKDMGLPVTKIKEEIKIVEPDPHTVQFQVSAYRRIPLIQFGAKGPEPSRGRGRGVSYRLGGQRRRAPRAFIATMKSGHRGVFQRREGAGRNPIVELHGPSILRVVEKFVPLGEARANEVLPKNFEHEISYALSKAAS